GDVDDRAAAPAHFGEHRADRAHVAHDVQLPHLVPLRVRDRVEVDLVCDADVVDEAIDRAGLPNELSRRIGVSEIGGDAKRFADAGRTATARRHNACTPLGEHLRDSAADATRRAGDDADAIAKPEIHGRLAYSQ